MNKPAKKGIQDAINTRVQEKVNLRALGNSKRRMQDVAVDLVNAADLKWSVVAAGTFLSPSTIKKLATGKTQRPQAETVERIFRFFDMGMELVRGTLDAKFKNAPKK